VQLLDVIPGNVSESIYCKYYPERGLPNGRPPVSSGSLITAYIGCTRKNVTHAGIGRVANGDGVVRVKGFCPKPSGKLGANLLWPL